MKVSIAPPRTLLADRLSVTYLVTKTNSECESTPPGSHAPTETEAHELATLTTDNLENLTYSVDDLSLTKFLRDYIAEDPQRASSVHNFMARSEYAAQMRPSPFVEQVTQELLEVIRTEFAITHSRIWTGEVAGERRYCCGSSQVRRERSIHVSRLATTRVPKHAICVNLIKTVNLTQSCTRAATEKWDLAGNSLWCR